MKLILILLMVNVSVPNNLAHLRALLIKAYNDKDAANELSAKVENYNLNTTPILIGYKGMAEMMKCRHTIFPIEKWLYFNRGRKLLEIAIKKEPYNVELRYFRFTVQTNAPAILGYNTNKSDDKHILLSYLMKREVSDRADSVIYHNIKHYMLSTDYCTRQEKLILNTLQ